MYRSNKITSDFLGPIAVFVGGGSSLSRWGAFFSSTKKNVLPGGRRLMNGIFKQLLNVKGTVVEDVRITDSPLRSGPVLEIRVRPRGGMLRCSRCGRKRRGYARGAAGGGSCASNYHRRGRGGCVPGAPGGA